VNRLRKRLTYGNVTATIAVFLAMSGAAVAVTTAPKNSVTSASIKDGEVKTPDVRGGAVTAAKIRANSVGSGKVVDSSLGASDLATGSVGSSELAGNSVGEAKIADQSIETADLANDSVVGAKILDGQVSTSEIGFHAIQHTDIDGNAVGSEQVKDLITATSGGTVINAGQTGDAQVTCPNGGMVAGGGFAWQDDEVSSIIYSTPSESDPNHTWMVRGMVPAGSNTLYAWASCLDL
jgi:hypothetical protein